MLSTAAIIVAALTSTSPQPASVRDGLDEAAVDRVFASYDREDSPGVALGIVRDGELVYVRGYGMANLEKQEPLTGDTVLRIGSTSKQFTAACAVLAEQQGALSLDADIRTYLPEMPEYDAPITMRHLLHHTSGVRDYLGLMGLAGYGDSYYSNEAAYQMIARQKGLNFPTGSRHLYSNSGYFLISVIIERRTGMTLSEFAEKHIFGPLGMTSSHFHDDNTHVVEGRANGYSQYGDGNWVVSNTDLEMCGDGGVFTSVSDMLKWDANFYEPKVGGQAMLDALHGHGFLNDGTELDYALGLGVSEYRGLRQVSHGGAFVGFRADTVRFPDQKVSVITFANLAEIDPSSLAFKVADIVLAEEFASAARAQPTSTTKASAKLTEPKFIELPAETLDRFAASYLDQASGNVIAISRSGEALLLQAGGQSLTLRPTSELEFAGTNPVATLRFEPSALEGFWNAKASVGNTSLVLGPYLPWDPSFMSLEDYAGTFFSEELQTTWTLSVAAGSLMMTNGKNLTASLAPLAMDAFNSPAGVLVFQRDAFQRLTSFGLNAGRVLGLRFVRQE